MVRQDALTRERYRQERSRWGTEFDRWVSDHAISRIVNPLAHDLDLRVTNQTVSEWLQSHPRIRLARRRSFELCGSDSRSKRPPQHGREVPATAGRGPLGIATVAAQPAFPMRRRGG